MLLLSGQGCGQPMQHMREGLMHGVCMWIPSRFAGRVYQSQPEGTPSIMFLTARAENIVEILLPP